LNLFRRPSAPRHGGKPSSPRRLLAGITILAVAIAGLVGAPPTYGFGGDGLRAEANELRLAGRLAPVVGTALLDDIATKRASQMATAGKLEHDMAYVMKRLNASGVCWSGVGEIIAWARGYPTYSYERTLQQWWNSPTHKAILMTAEYNAAGGAWQRTADTSDYSVMIFVTLCGADTPSVSSTSLSVQLSYSPAKRVYFAAGQHVGYKLSASGAVLGTKAYTLGSGSSAPATGRSVVNGKAYLRISSGVWAGYWIPETGRSYVMGVAWSSTYANPRTLYFAAGTYTGLKYDSLGTIVARKTYKLASASSAPASAYAIINGQPHFLVSAGVWAGYWVLDTAGVR
jgi:hypothetical protein